MEQRLEEREGHICGLEIITSLEEEAACESWVLARAHHGLQVRSEVNVRSRQTNECERETRSGKSLVLTVWERTELTWEEDELWEEKVWLSPWRVGEYWLMTCRVIVGYWMDKEKCREVWIYEVGYQVVLVNTEKVIPAQKSRNGDFKRERMEWVVCRELCAIWFPGE